MKAKILKPNIYIDSGMGAALLRTPEKLIDILTSLVTQVGKPYNIPISVKIRLLETEEKTIDLVKKLVKTGIECLTVHCRTTPMRPREPCIRAALKKIANVCHDAKVYCLVNGDVEKYSDLDELIKNYGVDGAMIARGAETNPSCFNINGVLPWYKIINEYLEYCEEFENHVVNTKYCMSRMIPGKSPLYQKVARSKSIEEIRKCLKGVDENEASHYVHKFKSPSTMLEEQNMKEIEIGAKPKTNEKKCLKRVPEFEFQNSKKKFHNDETKTSLSI